MQNETEFVRFRAKENYEKIQSIWNPNDLWHERTRLIIESFVDEFRALVTPDARILNIGSAGNSYEIFPHNQVHVDLARNHLLNLPMAVVADAEHLPFDNEIFDIVLCLGSVINYCSAAELLHEIHRVMVSGGMLVFDYETSDSLEYLLTKGHRKAVALGSTFYQHRQEQIWLYSIPYMSSLTDSLNFTAVAQRSFHVISPLAYLLTRSPNFSARFQSLDCTPIGMLLANKFAGNKITSCRKDT